MNKEINELLPFVEKPGRYFGEEINSVKKVSESVTLKIALAFPDLYEIGTSNLGLQILYHILNETEYIAAERVFAPWTDMEAILREKKLPLCSLESSIPLNRFDVVGFSLQHELTYTNVLNMLNLGGIPLLSSERDKDHPLVIAGGPSVFNPEPMSDFIDAFLIGDGEEALPEICDIYIMWKKRGAGRSELLNMLSEVYGIYIPSFFTHDYDCEGSVKSILRHKPGYDKVHRRIVADLDKAAYPAKFILPNVRPVHDRIPIEVARGCSRFCKFCQAAFTYLPVRERSPAAIKDIGENALKNTGHDEVALLSLSTGDYSCLEYLLADLNSRYKSENRSLSFPSLRVDTITPKIMEEMRKTRSGSFTIAPEAGSERLRKFINKDVTENQIIKAVREISSAGCRSIKLYFMIGLPTETEEDLEEIIRLSKLILKEGKRAGSLKKITVNISNFVPKPHTPFQWEKQDSCEETREKLSYFKKKIKDRNISLKWQNANMSILEGLFSRGDRKTGAAIMGAFRRGCRFDGWSDVMDFSLWEEAFCSANIDISRYLGRRAEGEILPWDTIETGIKKDFLLNELKKSFSRESTDDCRTHRCCNCGVCDHKTIKNITFKSLQPAAGLNSPPAPEKKQESAVSTKLRVKYSKRDTASLLGHIDTMIAIIRMLRHAGLPLAYSKGFHPAPRVSLSSPIPLGTESLSEYFDLELTGLYRADKFIESTAGFAPHGIEILEANIISGKGKSLAEQIIEEKYMVNFPDKMVKDINLDSAIENFNKAEEFIVLKKTKRGEKSINLKDQITELFTETSGNIGIGLQTEGGRQIRLEDAVVHIFNVPENLKKNMHILKTDTLFSIRHNIRTACG